MSTRAAASAAVERFLASPTLDHRNAVVDAYGYLCARGARRFRRRPLDGEDLQHVAAIGLIKACRRYCGHTGTPFEAYAWRMVLGELMHYVRDREPLVRSRTARVAVVSLLPGVEPQAADVEDRILARIAVDGLPARERTVVLGLYGLGLTQAELAQRLGISQRHVSRLHARALRAVRDRLREQAAGSRSPVGVRPK